MPQEAHHFDQAIDLELIKQLYRQIPAALWGESLAAIGLVTALWGTVPSSVLSIWLIFNLVICGIARHLLVFFFNRTEITVENKPFWLTLFTMGAFFSGLSWGFTGAAFVVDSDMVHQTFTTFLLIGITAAANPFYSAKQNVYTLFLLPAFIPFSLTLFFQGGIFIILGFLALVYIVIMLLSSFYFAKLIYNSLYFRFERINLVHNLSFAKSNLENRTNELEKSLSLIRATLESTSNGILVINSERAIEDFNLKLLKMWHIDGEELKDKVIDVFLDKAKTELIDPVSFTDEIYSAGENEKFIELQFKDGRVFECNAIPQRIGKMTVGHVWSFRDVTIHKSLEDRLFHKANFDSLTDLPNRSLVLDRLRQALANAKQSGALVAVLFLDLDRFKLINDTLGHIIGDRLLVEVANRLLECIGETDTVSREGGDEFVIILSTLHHENDSIIIARKILANIREPFIIEGNKFTISISFGISFYPKDGEKADTLLKHADIAMYRAKELGRNNFQFFTQEMNERVLSRLVIENQLRNALELNEFTLIYQPIVNIKTGTITNVEALLRWLHPKLGEISPTEFISIAEESGMIIPIGDWVLRSACAQTKMWHRQGFKHLGISVNISGKQFKQNNFVGSIQDILYGIDLDPHYLTLEITESIVMDDVEKNIEMLNKLKKMGISIVVDDFGVGYSSLNYLKRLPVDKLKIDRSFVRDIPYHTDDMAITAAIIALAGKLNLKVIAEGVETEQQLQFLIQHQCDELQGYFFSQGLPIHELTKLLHENKKLNKPVDSH